MFRYSTSLPGLRRLYLRTSSVICPDTAEDEPWMMTRAPPAMAALTLSEAPAGPPWLSYSASSTGAPFQPPPWLIPSSPYLTAGRYSSPVQACGPDRVSTSAIFSGAAWAAPIVSRPQTDSIVALFVYFTPATPVL